MWAALRKLEYPGSCPIFNDGFSDMLCDGNPVSLKQDPLAMKVAGRAFRNDVLFLYLT